MKPLRLRLRPGTALASGLLAAFAASSVACGASASAPRAPEAVPHHAEPGPMPSPPPAPGDPMPADLGAMGNDEPAKEAPPAQKAATAPAPSTGPAPAGAKTSAAEAAADAPLIVYQGDLTLRVDAGSGPGAVDTIVAMAEALGGHLAGRDEGRVTVKIPSRRFREAMSQIDGAFDVERRTVKAEDVTAEFKDLEVRLENLRATRKRIEELMQKSGTLADTLSVERELERVAGEIDRIQGRLRFLRTHTSFSTLTATVVEKPKAPQIVATKTAPTPKRDLALPLGWLDRVGVDTLVSVPAED
jgi:hypothetical protein